MSLRSSWGAYATCRRLDVERPELPFLRFLEKPRVYYPKIELVVDAELSTRDRSLISTTPHLPR